MRLERDRAAHTRLAQRLNQEAPDRLWCHGTWWYVRHLRLVRVRRTYSAWGPGGKLPCASGTYSTQAADTRSPYVQYGGCGAYVLTLAERVIQPADITGSSDPMRIDRGVEPARHTQPVAQPAGHLKSTYLSAAGRRTYVYLTQGKPVVRSSAQP